MSELECAEMECLLWPNPRCKRREKGQLNVLGDERCMVGGQTSVVRGKGSEDKGVKGQG